MTTINHADYIVYLGSYLDAQIIAERQLPGNNPAGSNRQRRIAEAIHTAGKRVLIISQAIAIKIPWRGWKWHPAEIRRAGKVPVIFTPALGIPILGYFLEGVFIIRTLIQLAKIRQFKIVILYDFPPSYILASIYLRLKKIKIIHNVEDISAPSISDWHVGSENNPLKQIVAWVSMLAISSFSNAILIPTRRFLQFLPSKKPYLVVTGCAGLQDLKFGNCRKIPPVNLLLSGALDDEHGISITLEAITILYNHFSMSNTFHLNICGGGRKQNIIQDYILKHPAFPITFHGFVSSYEYRVLLSDSDICLALQHPQGRHSELLTPSKAYELIAAGKVVISTDVGDLKDLPPHVVTILRNWDSHDLASILRDFIDNPLYILNQGKVAKDFANQHFSYKSVGLKITNWIHSIN